MFSMEMIFLVVAMSVGRCRRKLIEKSGSSLNLDSQSSVLFLKDRKVFLQIVYKWRGCKVVYGDFRYNG